MVMRLQIFLLNLNNTCLHLAEFMSFLSNFIYSKPMPTTITLNDTQWDIILEAVEDYAVLVSEDEADKCGEILDIIEAERTN